MADEDDKTNETRDNVDITNQGTALRDPAMAFNPAIQEMDKSPGVAAARAEQEARDPNHKRRSTVSVNCGVRGGIVMQLHTLPENADLPADFVLGHQERLRYGANPGIDKKFFEYWKSQNSGLGVVVEGLVTAQDESPPETAKEADERDKPDGESSSSAE